MREHQRLQRLLAPVRARNTSAVPEAGEALHPVIELQQTIGNRATQQVLGIAQRQPTQTAPATQEDLSKKTYEELVALKESLEARQESSEELNAVSIALDSKVKAIFDSFPDGVKKDPTCPTSTRDRCEFLEFMAAYLGSVDDVISHFKAIRKADVPGEVWLHEDAASRLESVKQQLNGEVPASWVGLGLRGRYRAHTRESNSRMAHPLGYAIDYRPDSNPMVTDSNLNTLLQMDVGESTSMQMGMTSSARRDLIEQMGEDAENGQSSGGKEVDTFFDTFDQEYERLSAASKDFGTSLGDDKALPELRQLREKFFKAKDDEAKASKRLKQVQTALKKKPDDATLLAEQQTLQTQITTSATEIQEVLTRVQEIIKPWLDQIAEKKKALEEANPKVFDGTDTSTQAKAIKKEWATYDSLKTRLETDINFIFGSRTKGKNGNLYDNTPKDPGVMQLLSKGFFTPDAAPAAGEKFNPNRHGFDADFMKTMMQHGFDQGITWSTIDGMHFELVAGVDSLPGKKETEKALKELVKRFPKKK
jgi:hypothetical protein